MPIKVCYINEISICQGLWLRIGKQSLCLFQQIYYLSDDLLESCKIDADRIVKSKV